MAHLNVVDGLTGIVIEPLLARHQVFVAEVEIPPEAVAFRIYRLRPEAVAAVGIQVACEGQVHILAQGQVVAPVLQEIPPAGIIPEGRHHDAGGASGGERKIGKGQGDGRGHIHDVEVAEARDHFLAGHEFCLAHPYVVIGVNGVLGGGELALAQKVDRIVFLLGSLSVDLHRIAPELPQPRLLLGPRIPDDGLFRVEIEPDRIRDHLVGALFEEGQLGIIAHRIADPPGIYLIAGVVEHDDARFQFGVLVIDFGLVVQVDLLFGLADAHIILGLVGHLVEQGALGGLHRVAGRGVGCHAQFLKHLRELGSRKAVAQWLYGEGPCNILLGRQQPCGQEKQAQEKSQASIC